MDIVLIAGLWLRSTVWSDTIAMLERHGHSARAVGLPGVDDERPGVTLNDHVEAVLAAVDAVQRPLVVGHSAASSLAWIAADRRAGAIGGVVLIGGFPAIDGSSYADFFPVEAGGMAFPGWSDFEGPDSIDLDEATKEAMLAAMVPVPAAVARGVVRLSDERRFDTPAWLLCPEFGPEDAQAWIDAGDVPELASARHCHLVDIDSGHWPMISQAPALAEHLHRIAVSTSG
jgi:pimeloyl-ACP methyl ester carboxylesterase